MKIYKRLHRGLKHGMHRKVVCMFSCEPIKKLRALKRSLRLSWSMSPLPGPSLQPPRTGNSLLVPSSKINGCSITQETPKKERHTAVLQVTGLHDPPGPDVLLFVTACPRPPHFHNVLASFSRILCQTDLYLTLQERYAQKPQRPTADARKERSSSPQKRKDMPGAQRGKGQMCGVAGCQICSLIML